MIQTKKLYLLKDTDPEPNQKHDAKIVRSRERKFNPDQYLGKTRVYIPVKGAHRISTLYVWNEELKQYVPPALGKRYMARRYEPNSKGTLVRKEKFFETLDYARKWQAGNDENHQSVQSINKNIKEIQSHSGPLFKVIVNEWMQRIFPQHAKSTCVRYRSMVQLYMQGLMDLGIREIVPQRIDLWLDQLKREAIDSPKRKNFSHELKLLSTILKYYNNYYDDPEFQFPIKERHRQAIWLKKKVKPSSKDLTVEEFFEFRNKLLELKNGKIFAAMATVQYFQALRISEAAALHWEDVRFDIKDPAKSRLCVQRAVIWLRQKEHRSFIDDGYKNARSNGGIKEQPLFPEAYEALRAMMHLGNKGLVFRSEGKHFEYRSIQYAYDTAFKCAGLPYTGTHIMRHGGCRNIYNEAPDLAVAQQLLGNSSLQTTLIYAKRSASALSKVAETHWQKKGAQQIVQAENDGIRSTEPELGGCNWLQKENPEPQVVGEKVVNL